VNIDSFDIRLLRVFDALASEGSVTRAAARLNLTQSATSQALGKLREALGDPLFVRVGQSMLPTTKASVMAVQVREALRLMSEALDAATVFDASKSRRAFRIAASDYALSILLPELCRRTSRSAPGIQIIASSVNPDRGLEYIRAG
jgi:DNA-binding transcriptional LysR family regulator